MGLRLGDFTGSGGAAKNSVNRRCFIGGSDARTIIGPDEDTLIHLWREKRGEVEPKDLSGNLIVQLGNATEPLNRAWYERNTGRTIKDFQRRGRHPVNCWNGGVPGRDGLGISGSCGRCQLPGTCPITCASPNRVCVGVHRHPHHSHR